MTKIALVTGSAKNLGKAIALDLAKQGFTVALAYLNSQKEAKQTLKKINRISRGEIFRADLKDNRQVKNLIKQINLKLGSVDILINLIGNFIYTPINKTSFDKFKDVIESNLYSTFLCCQAVLPQMQKRKYGRIINFGCVGAESLTVRKNTTPYYIAKSGVIMLTKVLAYEYAKYNITVNSVSPGILNTSVVKTKTPTNRFTDFSDIQNAINFLLKEDSAYINGANIEVSGAWRPGFEG